MDLFFLIFLLAAGSLLSLSNALKCYVCSVKMVQGLYIDEGTAECVWGNMSSKYLKDYPDGVYCLTYKNTITLLNLNVTTVIVTRNVVTRSYTSDTTLDGKCQDTAPGFINDKICDDGLLPCKKTACYCQSDGCNTALRARISLVFLIFVMLLIPLL